MHKGAGSLCASTNLSSTGLDLLLAVPSVRNVVKNRFELCGAKSFWSRLVFRFWRVWPQWNGRQSAWLCTSQLKSDSVLIWITRRLAQLAKFEKSYYFSGKFKISFFVRLPTLILSFDRWYWINLIIIFLFFKYYKLFKKFKIHYYLIFNK